MGYDGIFQFTLVIKLAIFMFVFGINTEKEYRYLTLAFVISYYFYQVRDIYIEHYANQRRVLQTSGIYNPPPPNLVNAQLN